LPGPILSGAGAAAPTLGAAGPLPRSRLRPLAPGFGFSFCSTLAASFLTSGTGFGGGPLPSLAWAALASASSLAASSRVISGGNSTVLPSLVRYRRFPPSPSVVAAGCGDS
jgi:hypothetical protein